MNRVIPRIAIATNSFKISSVRAGWIVFFFFVFFFVCFFFVVVVVLFFFHRNVSSIEGL